MSFAVLFFVCNAAFVVGKKVGPMMGPMVNIGGESQLWRLPADAPELINARYGPGHLSLDAVALL